MNAQDVGGEPAQGHHHPSTGECARKLRPIENAASATACHRNSLEKQNPGGE